MRAVNTVAASRVVGIGQVAIALLAGAGLAFLAASGAPLLLVAATMAALFIALFLQRPDVGFLVVLVARASSDALLMLITVGDWATLGGIRSLILNPNTAMILTLIGAGGVTIFARRLPMISLPGGVLVVLSVLAGLIGIMRSDYLLFSFQEWVPMLAVPVTYTLAAGMFPRSAAKFRVPKALAASFVLPAAVGYYQLFTGGGRSITGLVRVYGTFVHPNPFGLYLVIITAVFLPLAFFRSRMGALSRVILILAVPLLLATYARFAWVGALVVLICVGIMRHRILLLVIPLLGLVALVPTVQARLEDPFGGSFADRVGIWEGIYEQWVGETKRDGTLSSSIASVLGGLGPGAATLLTMEFREGRTIAPHNDYIRVLVDYGVVGLLFYLAIAVLMIQLGYQAYQRSRDQPAGAIALSFFALAVAYPIMSITSNIITATYNQVYFWALAGLCVSLRARAREEADSSGSGIPTAHPGRSAMVGLGNDS